MITLRMWFSQCYTLCLPFLIAEELNKICNFAIQTVFKTNFEYLSCIIESPKWIHNSKTLLTRAIVQIKILCVFLIPGMNRHKQGQQSRLIKILKSLYGKNFKQNSVGWTSVEFCVLFVTQFGFLGFVWILFICEFIPCLLTPHVYTWDSTFLNGIEIGNHENGVLRVYIC